MKNILCLSFSILFSLFINPTHAATPKEQSLDNIVAVVNDVAITQTELNEAMDAMKKQMASNNAPTPAESILRKQILQQMIDRKIQLQLAEQAGIKVDDAQIDKTINHIAENNNVTATQLYEQVTQQGLTTASYRKEIHDEMIIQQIQQQQVGAKITVTPQEVKDFMHSKPWQASNNKEYHLEDILIELPDSPTTDQIQEARSHASAVLGKIHHGMSFRSAAIEESSGNKALQGGDLGWRKVSEIPSAFAERVLQMKANDIAGPIQTSNGFHIIHVAAIRETATKDTESSREVEQQLYQRKIDEAIQTWIAKLRSQAFINMNTEDA